MYFPLIAFFCGSQVPSTANEVKPSFFAHPCTDDQVMNASRRIGDEAYEKGAKWVESMFCF